MLTQASIAQAFAATATATAPAKTTATLRAKPGATIFYIKKSQYRADANGLLHGVLLERAQGLIDASCWPAKDAVDA